VISWPLGWWYPGLRLNRINRVYIQIRCIFFFGSLSRTNLQVKRACLGAIWDGWPTRKFSRVRMSEDKVCTKDLCWSVETIYDPRELPRVSTAGPEIGRGVTATQALTQGTIKIYTHKWLSSLQWHLWGYSITKCCSNAYEFFSMSYASWILKWDVLGAIYSPKPPKELLRELSKNCSSQCIGRVL
jgi:hypothetical protein